jgi:hypothetical protein
VAKESQYNLWMTHDLKDRLKDYCEKERYSMNEVIIKAIEKALPKGGTNGKIIRNNKRSSSD